MKFLYCHSKNFFYVGQIKVRETTYVITQDGNVVVIYANGLAYEKFRSENKYIKIYVNDNIIYKIYTRRGRLYCNGQYICRCDDTMLVGPIYADEEEFMGNSFEFFAILKNEKMRNGKLPPTKPFIFFLNDDLFFNDLKISTDLDLGLCTGIKKYRGAIYAAFENGIIYRLDGQELVKLVQFDGAILDFGFHGKDLFVANIDRLYHWKDVEKNRSTYTKYDTDDHVSKIISGKDMLILQFKNHSCFFKDGKFFFYRFSDEYFSGELFSKCGVLHFDSK